MSPMVLYHVEQSLSAAGTGKGIVPSVVLGADISSTVRAAVCL